MTRRGPSRKGLCVELSEGGTRHAYPRGFVKSSLDKKRIQATAAAYMNETTKKVDRVLAILPSQEDLNAEEASN